MFRNMVALLCKSEGYRATRYRAHVSGVVGPSEVLVSQTVRDLVAGSGLAFESRGAHTLKDMPSEWYLNAAWQLFVSEPFNNTIAVINLVVHGTANQVFGVGSVSRINSSSLKLPVDLAAVHRDVDNVRWASNTTLDDGSDFYVANRGDNTIVRMRQNGSVVAVRLVMVEGRELGHASLNGI